MKIRKKDLTIFMQHKKMFKNWAIRFLAYLAFNSTPWVYTWIVELWRNVQREEVNENTV